MRGEKKVSSGTNRVMGHIKSVTRSERSAGLTERIFDPPSLPNGG